MMYFSGKFKVHLYNSSFQKYIRKNMFVFGNIMNWVIKAKDLLKTTKYFRYKKTYQNSEVFSVWL